VIDCGKLLEQESQLKLVHSFNEDSDKEDSLLRELADLITPKGAAKQKHKRVGSYNDLLLGVKSSVGGLTTRGKTKHVVFKHTRTRSKRNLGAVRS
jgi:hypothetical protein